MSVRSGMADCAVALDALCLRMTPPESLDVTKLAHALVTLARPRRRVSGHSPHGSARSWGRAPYTTGGRCPPTGLSEVAGLRAKAAGLGLSLRAARPLAANLNVDGNRSSHMPAGDAMVAGGRRTA